MSSSPATREDVLEVLKYLRDHDYIQGLNSIQGEKVGKAIDWEAARTNLTLDACFDQGCIGSMADSSIHITPVGLKALL